MTGKNSGLEISLAANLVGADAFAEALSRTIAYQMQHVANRLCTNLLIAVRYSFKPGEPKAGKKEKSVPCH